MEKLRYDIVLSAPIGDKKGTLEAEIDGERLEGRLIIMRNENYFCGTIGENGGCEISGRIKTLTGNVAYIGKGRLGGGSLALVLDTGKRKLVVTGEIGGKGGDAP